MKSFLFFLLLGSTPFIAAAQSLAGSESFDPNFPDGVVMRVRTSSGEINLGGIVRHKLSDDEYTILLGPFNTEIDIKLSTRRIGRVSNPMSPEIRDLRNTQMVGIVVFEVDFNLFGYSRNSHVTVNVTGHNQFIGQITRNYRRGGIKIDLLGPGGYYIVVRNHRVVRSNLPDIRHGDDAHVHIMSEAFRIH